MYFDGLTINKNFGTAPLIYRLNETNSLKEFILYWHSTWELNGLFPPELWNAYDTDDPNLITNDGIERFHETMHIDLLLLKN